MGGQKRSRSDVVDLTQSDDEGAFEPAPKAPRSSQQNAPRSSLASQASFDSVDDENHGNELIPSTQGVSAETEYYELYGVHPAKVVGIRYYNGYANAGETVILRREPENQYDRNAIQVLNVNREQVGHVPRQIAAKLAKYLDQHELIAEGKLSGRRGEFDIPLSIALYGTSDPEARQELRNRMQKDHLNLDAFKKKEKEEKAKRAAELKKVAKGKRPDKDAQWNNGTITNGDGLGPQEIEEIMDEATVFNPRDAGKVAEQYGAQEEQLLALPKEEQPAGISTPLLPFQLQGVAWLLEHENPKLPEQGGDDVVQLWKRPSNKQFTNIATNFSQSQEPRLARGGILADDMGLGKTVQIISLIVADRQRNGDRVGPTLIVAPVSVMSNWSGQAELHVDKKASLKVYTYHGQGRKKMKADEFKQYDIVITTYGTLSVEYMPKGSKKAPQMPTKDGLYSFQWRRIVLDEGHNIRNPNTKNALAASAIDAYAKWALTGTPIINSLKDLFSLVKFIGLTGGLDRLEIFNSVLIRPMKEGQADAGILLQALMGTICLRRRKDMSFIDLKLPSLTEYVHHVELTSHEQKKYDALQVEARGMLSSYNQASSSGNSRKAQETYRHLLEILLRLRQVCNHWKMCESRVLDLMSLLSKKGSISLTPDNVKALQDLLQLSIESQEECPICMDTLTDPVITPCAHVFCRPCIQRPIELQHKCPMDRNPLEDDTCLVGPAVDCGEDASAEEKVADEDTSAKTDDLLKLVGAIHKKDDTKIVIFSQWRRYLDIIEPRLAAQGQKTARIDGSMPAHLRDKSLRQFDSDPSTTILLASLGVCAVGLNLVAANTVIMCDSWWAPAIEDQAIDRVHRLGQKRQCTVWRLVVKGSIEERTLEVQGEKRKLMAVAMREGEGAGRRKRGRGTVGNIQKLLG
ncbi:SNF2 family N-terminal domain-containing protein 8 [Elsinoe fawcettii]|nr:SNF2 family N-terminal domain-containing protein 8 [Elsinoe fawcettii]